MDLFQLGKFVLASGAESRWKIECDAFGPGDWAALAQMAAEVLPPFGRVLGVPRGGLPFAQALRDHVTDGPLLIAEDVVTTGGSIIRFYEALPVEDRVSALGVAVFARTSWTPVWIHPLFTMNEVNPLFNRTGASDAV